MNNAVFLYVTPCDSVLRLVVTANVPSSPILVNLMMEAIVPPKHRSHMA
jgi:hypothetical protein